MKKFRHIHALTIDDAVSILHQLGEKAKVIAGGTDLLGQMKNRIHPTYPEVVVNLKTIPDLDYIQEDGEGLKIGALAKLRDIAEHPSIKEKYSALAQAARAVGSWQIRVMGTLGGNLCQDCRCWYYRAPKNYFQCVRKKGAPKEAKCYAVTGDHRYHSIFGAAERCFAVNPSDTAPALIALNAKMKTTKRTLEAEEFFTVRAERTTILEADEILTEIRVPLPAVGTKSSFFKYALRKSIDFPIVNCASAVRTEGERVKEAKICLNAVYNLPYRANKAEGYIKDRCMNESVADEASKIVMGDARPLRNNKYMVQIAKWLLKRALLSCQ